jgi:hypothetical protein
MTLLGVTPTPLSSAHPLPRRWARRLAPTAALWPPARSQRLRMLQMPRLARISSSASQTRLTTQLKLSRRYPLALAAQPTMSA